MIIQSSPLPEFATIQSGVDSNLNSDTAGDRAVINASGAANVGSGVTGYNAQGRAVAAGDLSIVAYVANNPNARYIVAGLGAYATGGRNTFPLDHTNNFDVAFHEACQSHRTDALRYRCPGVQPLQSRAVRWGLSLGRSGQTAFRATSSFRAVRLSTDTTSTFPAMRGTCGSERASFSERVGNCSLALPGTGCASIWLNRYKSLTLLGYWPIKEQSHNDWMSVSGPAGNRPVSGSEQAGPPTPRQDPTGVC